MLGELSSVELTEWMAYDLVEPISTGWRVDRGTAMLAAILGNVYRNRDEHPDGFTEADFMPRYGLVKRKSKEDLYSMLRTWAVLCGSNEPRGGG